MRGQVYKGNPLDDEKTPDIPGIWAEYTPKTNLIWLLFLLKNLLKHKQPEQHQPPSQPPPREPLTPRHANRNMKKPCTTSAKSDLKKKKKTISIAADTTHAEENKENGLGNGQSQQQQQEQEQIAALKKTLSDRLSKVLELLDLKDGHEDMCCAADLVAYAIDSQWLDEKDFFT